MKVVIIEDEEYLAKDLINVLKSLRPAMEILAHLSSVEQAVAYFETHSHPDLIFSDIQLSDGLSFDIIRKTGIRSPIIFCTAYDEYLETAFKMNGIEYILKPYRKEMIENAIHKFEDLASWITSNIYRNYEKALRALEDYKKKEASALTIKYRDRTIPIPFYTIALFYLEYGGNHLLTFSGNIYGLSESLDELEKILEGQFFRINRQYLVNKAAILEVVEQFPRKGKVKLKMDFAKDILVSKEKKGKLIRWLSNKTG